MKLSIDRRRYNCISQNNMKIARKQKNECDYQSTIGNIALTGDINTVARLCNLVPLGGVND